MSDIDQSVLFVECRACADLREKFKELMYILLRSHQLCGPAVRLEPAGAWAVECSACKNTCRVLTEAGKALVELVTHYQTRTDKEAGNDVPF